MLWFRVNKLIKLFSVYHVMPSVGIGGSDGELGSQKPCRACSDFSTWAKIQKNTLNSGTRPQNTAQPIDKHNECPLDRNELGNKTWGFLHTMAAYYPNKPTTQESEEMSKFFYIFSKFYPCDHCAEDFRKDISINPPKTGSQSELSKWLCDMHNIVNLKLGKPIFDCSNVNKRWRDGWPDGSCD